MEQAVLGHRRRSPDPEVQVQRLPHPEGSQAPESEDCAGEASTWARGPQGTAKLVEGRGEGQQGVFPHRLHKTGPHDPWPSGTSAPTGSSCADPRDPSARPILGMVPSGRALAGCPPQQGPPRPPTGV